MKPVKFSKGEVLRLSVMVKYEIDNLTRDLDFIDDKESIERIKNRINSLNTIKNKLTI